MLGLRLPGNRVAWRPTVRVPTHRKRASRQTPALELSRCWTRGARRALPSQAGDHTLVAPVPGAAGVTCRFAAVRELAYCTSRFVPFRLVWLGLTYVAASHRSVRGLSLVQGFANQETGINRGHF
jgi:hypothetical protein